MHSLVEGRTFTPEGRKCDSEEAHWEVGSARVSKQSKTNRFLEEATPRPASLWMGTWRCGAARSKQLQEAARGSHQCLPQRCRLQAALWSGEQHQEIRLPGEPRPPKALKGILRPHHQELLQVFKSEEWYQRGMGRQGNPIAASSGLHWVSLGWVLPKTHKCCRKWWWD